MKVKRGAEITASSDPALRGRAVLVTRPRERAAELMAMLERKGAVPLLAPTIRLVPAPPGALDGAVNELSRGHFAWVLFTSAVGVDSVFRRLEDGNVAWSHHLASVGAIGEGTARALRRRGVEPALVPESFTTEGLGRAMPEGSGRVLLPRADIAPSGLEETLRRKGWTPVRVDAYRTEFPPSLPRDADDALRSGRVDAVTFTSPSTVTGYMRLAGDVREPAVVCIGPVTARAARDAGLRVDVEAHPHTIEGLVAALERALS